MNKLLLFLVVMGSPFTTTAQLAVEYRFETPAGVGTPDPYFVNGAILSSASPVYVGVGISAFTYFNGPTGGATNRAKASTNWTPAFNINKYFGTTLIPPPLNILVIDSVSFWAAKSNVGPTEIEVRSSPSNYSPNGWIGNNVGDVMWRKHSITVPLGMSPDSVGIRLYTYGTSLTNTTWRIDTLRVYAHLISTLPVELLSFDGEVVGDDVELRWTTGSEENNSHFDIERSADGSIFEKVGQVLGAGNSNIAIDYVFRDTEPLLGQSYYQLVQVDYDGTTTYSDVVPIRIEEASSKYDILDVTGRLVGEMDSTEQQFFTPENSGIYLLRDTHGKITKKILVIAP